MALDDPVIFLHVLELIEDLHAFGLFKGKGDGAVHFVLAHHINVHPVAHADGHVARGVTEFSRGDLPLGLEIHVHQHIVVIHTDDLAFGNGAFFKVAEIGIEIVFEGAFEINFVVPGFLVCHLPCLQIISPR